jgi:hypothetical protein
MSYKIIEDNLLCILHEIDQQDMSEHIPINILPYKDQLINLKEWIIEANEYGVAYESIVCLFESVPLKLSSSNAVKLLEIGLLLGYKTDRPEDKIFEIKKED